MPQPQQSAGAGSAGTPSVPSVKAEKEMLWDGKNSGKLPNMMWRAVSMDDLRLHPHFIPLPEPEEIVIESALDFRSFRQGSVQWCLLHDGRLTTSRMAPILGIYEPQAQRTLRVPRSLAGHHKALDAYMHLIRPPCDASELARVAWQEAPPAEGGRAASGASGLQLAGEPMSKGQRRRARGKHKAANRQPNDPGAAVAAIKRNGEATSSRTVWSKAEEGGKFGHVYEPDSKVDGPALRVESPGHARMIWGNTQEPTSMLAAVNYFHSSAGAVVHEVGVCPLEAVTSSYSGTATARLLAEGPMPLIGASPDSYLVYPDGSIEAIEVKNHAPFRAGGTTWKSSRRAAFAFSDPGPYNEVAAWHVPQVQLEMLCLGAHCRATNFLSCSATQGINIVRVKRDDKYIARMLQYARIFHESFTLPGQAPPANFAEELYPHYQDFLQDTLRISQTAEVIARIAPSDVQRSPYNRRLFLD